MMDDRFLRWWAAGKMEKNAEFSSKPHSMYLINFT
jgi:hypothetical protein